MSYLDMRDVGTYRSNQGVQEQHSTQGSVYVEHMLHKPPFVTFARFNHRSIASISFRKEFYGYLLGMMTDDDVF